MGCTFCLLFLQNVVKECVECIQKLSSERNQFNNKVNDSIIQFTEMLEMLYLLFDS